MILGSIELGERLGEKWSYPLAATGQLALTLYIAHVLVGMGFLEVIGRLVDQTIAWAWLTTAVFAAFSVAFAAVYRRRFSRGRPRR